jgi:hypothetical protein
MSDSLSRVEKRRLAILVHHWWNALLIGNPPPRTLEAYERARDLRLGDLVVEVSTLGHLVARDVALEDDRWDGQFIRFLRSEQRFTLYDDEPGGFTEQVWICENPDGSEFMWTNADLIAVPDALEWPEEVQPDGR